VVDCNLATARRAATRWQAHSFFDDPEEMLASVRPEMVSICTPDALHASSILTVLNSCSSVRAILAEKPLALTVCEAQEIQRRAEQKGVILAVNYSRRFCPAFQTLRNEIQNGALGEIQQVHGFYGKGLLHNGTHWIDLLRYLCADVSSVKTLYFPLDQPDSPALSLLLINGVPAILQPCRPEAFTLFEMDVLGTSGRVRTLSGGLSIERHLVTESPHFAGHRELACAKVQARCMTDSILHAVSDVISCLDHPGRQPSCTANDAIAALQVAASGMAQRPDALPHL
jgi:predicted dehydrogenase